MKEKGFRKFFWAVCLTMGVLFLFSGSPGVKAAEVGDIYVVLDAPMTGKIAYYGRDNRAAFQMAIERVNQKGIFVEGKRYQFVGIVQDNEGHKIDKVLKETAKNVMRHKPIAFIVTASAEAVPLKEVCMDYKFIMLAPSQVPAFTQPPIPLGVRNFMRCTDQGEMIQKIFEIYKPGQRKLFTLVEMNETTVEGARVAREMWKPAGGEVVGLVEFPSETLDYVPVVTKAISANPDIIFSSGSSVRGAMSADTARKQGYKGVFYFFGMFNPAAALRFTTPDVLEGTSYTATQFDKEIPLLTEFRKEVQGREKGESTPEVISGVTYEMIHFLAGAITKANSVSIPPDF